MYVKKKKDNTVFEIISAKWALQNRYNWKESTYSKYYHIVYDVLNPVLGKSYISEITSGTMREKAGAMLASGLSASTVRNYVTVLRSIMDFAAEEGYTCHHIGKMNCLKTTVPSVVMVLDKSEQKALEKVLYTETNASKLGILLALYTGIRCGELCALQWGDIDLKDRTVTISKTMQRIQDRTENVPNKTKIMIMRPKSLRSNRVIPLPDLLVPLLKKHQCTDSQAFVISGRSDSFIEPRLIQKHFKQYLQEAGIKDIKFHALRHTFATRCVELGFDIKSLSEILGHESVKTTLDLYVHSSFDMKKNNMKKLNKLAG